MFSCQPSAFSFQLSAPEREQKESRQYTDSSNESGAESSNAMRFAVP